MRRLFLALISVLLFSCATCARLNTGSTYYLDKARSAFVGITVTPLEKSCNDGACQIKVRTYGEIFGSGTIIRNQNFSYVLTAGHVCDVWEHLLPTPGYTPIAPRIKVQSLRGEHRFAKIVKFVNKSGNDLCLLRMEKFYPLRSVKISPHPPVQGQTYHNYAAPRRVWATGTVPHLTGTFDGYINDEAARAALYSISATRGSSGSMIIDARGRLVGVLYATPLGVDFECIAVPHKAIIDFLKGVQY